MDDSLARKALEHPPSHKLVVLRAAKMRGHRLESHQEPGEVGVLVQGARLGEVERRPWVASAKLN